MRIKSISVFIVLLFAGFVSARAQSVMKPGTTDPKKDTKTSTVATSPAPVPATTATSAITATPATAPVAATSQTTTTQPTTAHTSGSCCSSQSHLKGMAKNMKNAPCKSAPKAVSAVKDTQPK